MKKIIVAVALAGTATSAHAADLARKAPYYKAPVAQVYDWTGFYAGVNVGIGMSRNRTIDSTTPFPPNTVYLQPQGAFGGGQVGYNWQTGSFLGPLVLGVEADIQGANLTDSRTTLTVPPSAYSQSLDWFGTVRGRVGLATGPTLTYFTGGFAFGNVKTNAATFGNSLSTSRTETGWTLGSGMEAALGGNWTGKIEYLYLDLGNRTDGFAVAGETLDSRYRSHLFRIGANYRIGGNGTYAPIATANWTGLYVGGNVGSGTGRNPSSIVGGGFNENFNLAPDGLNGGVQAGYNWQAANWVFGLEADIQATTQRDNKTCVAGCSPTIFASFDAKQPWFGTVRGRLGYGVGPSLFYVTGGLAYGEIETKLAGANLSAPALNSFSTTRAGWTVGAGVETPFALLGLFGPNWTTKTEYLYVDLGSVSNTALIGTTPTTFTTHAQEHIFRTGLNYHFNSPVVAKY